MPQVHLYISIDNYSTKPKQHLSCLKRFSQNKRFPGSKKPDSKTEGKKIEFATFVLPKKESIGLDKFFFVHAQFKSMCACL